MDYGYWYKTRLSPYFDDVGVLYVKYAVRRIFQYRFFLQKLEGMTNLLVVPNIQTVSERV